MDLLSVQSISVLVHVYGAPPSLEPYKFLCRCVRHTNLVSPVRPLVILDPTLYTTTVNTPGVSGSSGKLVFGKVPKLSPHCTGLNTKFINEVTDVNFL